jgi:small-conductance mechanosensitive channel
MNLRFRIRTSLDSDPNLVKSIIIDVIGDCEFTTENPKTEVLLYDITETALVFRLDCWVEDYNKERKAKDWILIEILDRFKSKGIGIPFPHLTVKQE